MIFCNRIQIFTEEIWVLDQDGDLIFGIKKAQKSAVDIYPLSVQKCQDTKLILAPWFTVGKARVTQYVFLVQVSSKSVAKDIINSIHLQFSKNKFIFPVRSK